METTQFEIRIVPVAEMKPLISRDRPPEEFANVQRSIEQFGLIVPPQVVDKGRKNSEGIRYEIVGGGEGRWKAAKNLGWEEMPVLIINATPQQTAGRFMAENVIRKQMPWAEKGRMLREEIASGATLEEAAKRFCISENYARKCIRVINKIAHDAEEEIEAMPMNTAEVLTLLPKKRQKIVIETAALRQEPVAEVAKAAKAKMKGEDWTAKDLDQALKGADKKIEKIRKAAIESRQLVAFGHGNVSALIRMPEIKSLCKKISINLIRFQ